MHYARILMWSALAASREWQGHCVRTTTVHTKDGCLGLKVAMGVHFAARCVQCSIEGFTFSAQDINHRESTSVTLQSDQDVEQYTSVNTPWLELREATA